MSRSTKQVSMDVEEIFLEPEKAIALLRAGTILHLENEDGRIFARVEPTIGKRKTKPKKPRKTT